MNCSLGFIVSSFRFVLGVGPPPNAQYNHSAFCLPPPAPAPGGPGRPDQQYDKIHLVPFGEYVPLRGLFPFLSDLVPIGDFTPGKEYTLFSIDFKEGTGSLKQGLFGVLICFEDTLSYISRRFTQEGAQFLVNITNDAWFLDTPAPFMHLQASVFRAIENRRSLIRSANTGVSSFVDPSGRIYRYLQDTHGKKTFVEGYAREEVLLSQEKTFYTKFGDVFAYLCFGCILWGIFKVKKTNSF
jgi:apolipoprotein N-acyltransferase